MGPSLDTIHMLCAAFGDVAKITMFEKTGGLQVSQQSQQNRTGQQHCSKT